MKKTAIVNRERACQWNTRLTDEEWELCDDAVEESGLTKAEWTRQALLGATKTTRHY